MTSDIVTSVDSKPQREPLWFYVAMGGVYLTLALMAAWFVLFGYFIWLIAHA